MYQNENSRLNLPSFDYKIKESEGKHYIFDVIRKKYIFITPEEWVRQHFIHLLLSQYGYSRSLIRIEGGHIYNELNKRSDILVYDRNGLPHLLVECKSADIEIDKKTILQASIYNQKYKAPYLAVTNGINHFCWKIDHDTHSFTQLKDLPKFSE
ncbi:MAG: type I restriction enzyme HsdR N-terminal domain-containing protein [Cytophagaceae bacterium]